MCEHNWAGKSGTVQCKLCKAVGLLDNEKDPFGNGEVPILRPSQEDWREMGLIERHGIIEANKKYILADLQTIRKPAICEKWSISPSTLNPLLIKWGFRKQIKSIEEHGLPSLPAFDNTWLAEVQVKWLEIYARLLELRCGNKNPV